MLEIENTVTKIKTGLNCLICRLDMAEKRIRELEDMLVKFSQTEIQRKEKNRGEKIPGRKLKSYRSKAKRSQEMIREFNEHIAKFKSNR